MKHRSLFLLPGFVLLLSCAPATPPVSAPEAVPTTERVLEKPAMPDAVARMMPLFAEGPIRAHTRFLSSDELEGRAPGTRGDAIAAHYVATEFMALGLDPAGDSGTYYQKVPLIGIETKGASTSFSFVSGSDRVDLKYLDDYVTTNELQTEKTSFDTEIIFVGHGVVAPEYQWNDYKDVSVRGKVVLMLVDDPPASSTEPTLFGGKARTYYGRWTYKYEEALRQGAVGAILLHTDASAGYGWNVVRGSWGRQRPYVKLTQGEPALRMTSWITSEAATRLLKMSRKDIGALTESAHQRTFRPVALGVKAVSVISSAINEVNTANVIARLPGSDPALREEAVLYSAHLDHLGVATPVKGDAIYNGAIDNATGVAVLLEMARIWSMAQPRPRRSIIFAAVAAEEGGLRGSQFYAQNPVVAAGKTVVGLNFDSIEQFGRVRNVSMLGMERTTFRDVAERVTRGMDIRIDPDEHPEQGSYYRSDHFSLAKVGVPAFSIGPGSEYVGKPAEWGKKQFDDYNDNRYHQPSDEFDPSWDFAEGVQMAQLGFWLGWEAAELKVLPTWNAGDEFLAARQKSFGK